MKLPSLPLLPIVAGLFVTGIILQLIGSPFGELLFEAILNNREVALTFLILLLFKLFQKKINEIVDSTQEEVRHNYGYVFLFISGWLLFSSRNLTFWGKEMPSLTLFMFGVVMMAIPVLKGVSKVGEIGREKIKDI